MHNCSVSMQDSVKLQWHPGEFYQREKTKGLKNLSLVGLISSLF